MTMRPWLCVFLLAIPAATFAQDETDLAHQYWLRGQQAMSQGKPQAAIAFYEQSLNVDAAQKRIHLSLAAACVQCGDEAGAARHLTEYLAAFPEHHIVRKHYAELLLRLHHVEEARVQFERFIAGVQDDPALASKHLVSCYSRLMEIAQEEHDEFAEHLNRGIGLYLLGCERAELPDPDDGELSVESVLCKAAGELTMAHMARRNEARPCWYLYVVWSRLNQRQPALRHLREAESAAPFTYLTAAENRELAVACLNRDSETTSRKR